MPPKLPPDVLHHIIDILGTETRENYFSDLGACSLTCHALLGMTRKYTFRHVELWDDPTYKRKSTERFCQLLEDAPAISNLVKELTLFYRMGKQKQPLTKPEDAGHWELLSRGVAKLSCVRSLYLYSAGDPPDGLLPIIIHLLRLPTCTSLTLSCYLPFVPILSVWI